MDAGAVTENWGRDEPTEKTWKGFLPSEVVQALAANYSMEAIDAILARYSHPHQPMCPLGIASKDNVWMFT